MFNPQDNKTLPESYQLIREELVRQMAECDRWSGAIECWKALLHIRMMAEPMQREVRIHSGLDPETGSELPKSAVVVG